MPESTMEIQQPAPEAIETTAETIARLQAENLDLRAKLEQVTQERDRAIELGDHDALTELLNRRAGEELAAKLLGQAARSEVKLVCFRLDADHFKWINDGPGGHPWGDKILKSIARELQTTSRDTDIVSRYGGEEFDLYLPMDPETTDKEIQEMIDRYRMNIHDIYRHPHEIGEIPQNTEPLTASFGVVIINPGDRFSVQEIQDLVDKNLYQSKENGRDMATITYAYTPFIFQEESLADSIHELV